MTLDQDMKQRSEADARLIAQLTGALPPGSYAREVIKEAEELGELVSVSPTPYAGWRHYKGKLIDDGSAVCARCDSKKAYVGDSVRTGEYVRYAECGGDPDTNYYADRERYKVCLGCGHVSHFPPAEAS